MDTFDISVGRARGYGVDGPGSIPGMACAQSKTEAHPVSHAMGTGVERPGPAADHSTTYSAEISYTSTQLHTVPRSVTRPLDVFRS
jgi:hypothetical protein